MHTLDMILFLSLMLMIIYDNQLSMIVNNTSGVNMILHEKYDEDLPF